MNYMLEAIKEAYDGINNNHGGPFGTIIVKDGQIIGRGHNKVLLNKDPTCHGEMEAIRDACKQIGTHDLKDSILYTTAEPCPMCLGAILWANIKDVRFGCTVMDTDKIGFRDDEFYKSFEGKNKNFSLKEENRAECLKLFSDYEKLNRERY
ncbi:nucleoside deaminase [uncultured Treponema sp.]|uniref:nucleoside deaminase n=1 Tax=uncultured Treponema sp. TaxID=162155 RepID=UPI0025D232BC|nr:nucleoside deaminase [uncultured Treponema sp.]